ncbi:hypothetical protein ACH47Z_24680 [Streptomyces sp. NPDC020192]|uniref:hypothetical protein n=1 Tax=Streptomyces sp. NPDC020192 TaxID=3365066 RepID=UPI0037BA5EE5
MPEQTTPTHTRALGFGCGAIALAVILALGAWIIGNAQQTDYPRVAPGERARQVFRYSQEAYDVLGFTRAAGNTFSAALCYDNGPLGMEDKTVDGAYQLGHEWALEHVPESQAVSGLRRLRDRLTDEGWRITGYREGRAGGDVELYAQRDGGDARMTFVWYAHREYFTGFASVPCAYVPGRRTDDVGYWDPDSVLDSVPASALGPSPAH